MTPNPPAPPSTGKLDKYVIEYARREGLAVGRVRHWISFMMISEAIGRAATRPDGPRFLVKGGVALELRLGARARATDDLDVVAITADFDLVSALDEALREPVQDFSFTRRGPGRPMPGDSVRVEVQVAYRSQRWATVQVDVAPPDGDDVEGEPIAAISLEAFGLTGPAEIMCLSLRHHIAQKFHGMTKRLPNGRENDRSRDAIDLLLLRDLVGTDDLARVRVACEETFRSRGAHEWPPPIALPESWAEPLEAMAFRMELQFTTLEEVEVAVRSFLDSILTATETP